jgi:hypothetical protein
MHEILPAKTVEVSSDGDEKQGGRFLFDASNEGYGL